MEQIKKRRFGIWAALTLALVLVLFTAWALFRVQQNQRHQDTLDRVLKSGTITWGVKSDTKLFGLMDTKEGEPEGFDVDLARAVTKEIGREKGKQLKAKIMPTATASRIQLLKSTNIDATISTMTITPERAKVVDFSQSYFSAGQSLLVAQNSGIHSLQDLNSPKKTVLAVVGTTAAQQIKQLAPKAKIVALQDYASAMQALKAGQGQAVSTDNAILFGLAAENPGYHLVGGNYSQASYGIAFSKDQKAMVKATNNALDRIKADGTYNRLIKKWFQNIPGVDWHQLEVKE
ncbi:transporter substrate-binding domain-containing protein [Eupransor demetentiae]|uniref:Periplasmic component/domain (HisJ) n=1 Tax=Eupransor demetentiae TaxID=3109584 RepID=A0ABM9N6G6_9LACO|nr:ABC-type amino acid transport/signal transduction system [Lactobacillaceae bacterium LMG 33000]